MAASESPSSLSTARSSGLSKSSVDASAPILCTVGVGLGVGLIGRVQDLSRGGKKGTKYKAKSGRLNHHGLVLLFPSPLG